MEFLSDVMFWREALTLLSFALFLSIALWAYGVRQKPVFEEISLAVVNDDEAISPLLARLPSKTVSVPPNSGWCNGTAPCDLASSNKKGGVL